MTRIPKPRPRKDESADAYHERIAPWETMTRAATEVKTVRSRTADALRTVDFVLALKPDGHWYYREVPADQRARVEDWRQVLADALAALEALDVDAWKPEVIEAMNGRGES